MSEQRVAVRGAQKLVRAKRSHGAAVRTDREITVVLSLRWQNESKLCPLNSRGSRPVHQRPHLSVTQATAAFSANPADVAAVRRFAHKYHLRGIALGLGGAFMQLSGTVGHFNRAFGVKLVHCSEQKYTSTYHGHTEEVTVPAALEGIITGVFGLDTHPAARRPSRFTHGMSSGSITPPPVTSKTRRPAEFADFYKFPRHARGKGECIGLLEFGGGFRPRELKTYFTSMGMKAPNLIVREVSPGGANRPQGKPGTLNPDTEVYLDIEVAASLAPEAKIVVYFGDNTMQGWLTTLQAAILDKTHDPSVISISWGEAEQDWTPQALIQIDKLFQLAAHRGITICCSSGDRGISESSSHPFTVAFPASSPHVLACGGTRLDIKRSGSRNETVWNQWRQFRLASGGGVSDVFPLPPYQNRANVPLRHSQDHQPGRGIPDVAANASSDTGYLIEADRTRMALGGTSAVAPLWAALIARLNEAMGIRIGFLTPLLYTMNAAGAGAVCDITEGFNGSTSTAGFRARPGWDACTGLGSPNGEDLLQLLIARQAKGR
jgi:kumamolisin